MFHYSWSNCDCSSSTCFREDELIINATDAYIGYIHDYPLYKSSDQNEYWKHSFEEIIWDKFKVIILISYMSLTLIPGSTMREGIE